MEVLLERSGGRFWSSAENDASKLDACVAAAKHGHMHVVRWLLDRGYPLNRDAFLGAVLRYSELADAQWLLQQPAFEGYQPSTGVVCDAARCTLADAMDRLTWLLDELGCELHEDAVALAASVPGCLPTLQWLLDLCDFHETKIDEGRLMKEAAEAGVVDTVIWLLHRYGYNLEDKYAACSYAACAGQAEALAILWAPLSALRDAFKQLGMDEGLMDEHELLEGLLVQAGERGHVRTVKYLWGLGARTEDLDAFVEDADLEMCKWLHEQGALTQNVSLALHDAVVQGDVQRLAFLVEEVGAEFGEELLPEQLKDYANSWQGLAVGGNGGVQMLHKLGEYGCPLQGLDAYDTQNAFEAAVSEGRVDVLEWLWTHGFIFGGLLAKASHRLLVAAAKGGCQAMLEWLVGHGCSTQSPVCGAAAEASGPDEEEEPAQGQAYLAPALAGDLDTLRCLQRLGVPWGPDTFLEAVQACLRGPDGSVASWDQPPWVLRWMAEEGGAPWDLRAYVAACSSVRADVVAWMEAAGMDKQTI